MDNQGDPAGMFKQRGFEWHFGLDVDGQDAYQVTGIPMIIFIDAQGNIKERIMGAATPEQWEEALAQILPGGQGA